MGMFNVMTQEHGPFPSLMASCDPRDINKFCDNIYKKYCELFSGQNYLTNVEWIGRHYLAFKKIALSTLFYTQSDYLLTRQMKNLSHYSSYYAYFNVLSSNLLMSPHLELSDSRRVSHSSLAAQMENLYVRRGVHPSGSIKLLGDLRFARELYSYHLPLAGISSGLKGDLDLND